MPRRRPSPRRGQKTRCSHVWQVSRAPASPLRSIKDVIDRVAMARSKAEENVAKNGSEADSRLGETGANHARAGQERLESLLAG